MLFKNFALCAFALTASVESLKTNSQTFEDYVDSIRQSMRAPVTESKSGEVKPSSSMLEVENLKKPLTVSQFSEWLHNLYYNEEQKRKSAIKYMLENQFGKPQE